MNTKKFLKGAAFGVILGTVGAYLFNKNTGNQNRAKVKASAQKATKKLAEEVSKIPNITKHEYSGIVKKVIDDLKDDGVLTKESWNLVKKELDNRWEDIKEEVKKRAGKAKVQVKSQVSAAKKKAAASKRKKS